MHYTSPLKCEKQTKTDFEMQLNWIIESVITETNNWDRFQESDQHILLK